MCILAKKHHKQIKMECKHFIITIFPLCKLNTKTLTMIHVSVNSAFFVCLTA